MYRYNYKFITFSVSPTVRVIQLVRSMRANPKSSPRDLIRGILGSQKHLLDQKTPQNLKKEMSHLPLKVFHKPSYHSHLVSRQTQGKHMVHNLKPSQEKKEVSTRETRY